MVCLSLGWRVKRIAPLPHASFSNPLPHPQCDLLITSISLPSAAHCVCSHLLPAAGRDAVDDGGVATEAQLYGRPGDTFAVLQVRAPPLPGRAAAWQADLAAFASSAGVARLLVPASVPACGRTDAHLSHTPTAVVGVAAGAGASLHPGVPQLPPDDEYDVPREARRLPPWRLLAAAEGGTCPPVVALLSYASDGDNAGDAVALAAALAASLELEGQPKRWKAPAAWGAVYGAAARVVA